MNSRSLSPFLISFLMLGSTLVGTRLFGQQSPALTDLASLQSLPVDASGAFVNDGSRPQPAPQAAAPAPAPAIRTAPAPTAPKQMYSIDRDALVAALRRQIANHFNLSGDLSIDVTSDWTPPPASADPEVVSVVEYPSQLSPDFIVRVRVETSADDSRPDRTVMVHAQLWRNAWATRGPVNRGDLFVPGGLDVRRVDCLRNRDALFTDAATQNLAFGRGLPADQLLTWHDVCKRSLVHRGEIVEVVAVDGNLSVTMKGIAMQNGGMGDLVMVRNPESKREIPAMVVAENRAEVRF